MFLLFFKVMFTEFIAEMGDKTQLMLVALTSKFKIRDIVLGTAAAILVLNGLAVIFGGLLGAFIPDWIIKLVAAAAFLFFAITSLKKEDDEEEEAKSNKIKIAPLAVFCTFFAAELGDKTQLTAITFGANEVAANPNANKITVGIIVWLACSIGLFAADMIGMMVGYLLKSKLPKNVLNILSFVIFAIFGVYTLYQALKLNPYVAAYTLTITIAAGAVFAVGCVLMFILSRKKK